MLLSWSTIRLLNNSDCVLVRQGMGTHPARTREYVFANEGLFTIFSFLSKVFCNSFCCTLSFFRLLSKRSTFVLCFGLRVLLASAPFGLVLCLFHFVVMHCALYSVSRIRLKEYWSSRTIWQPSPRPLLWCVLSSTRCAVYIYNFAWLRRMRDRHHRLLTI